MNTLTWIFRLGIMLTNLVLILSLSAGTMIGGSIIFSGQFMKSAQLNVASISTNPKTPPPQQPTSYDILSFIAPPNGSLVPSRGLSGCITKTRGCGPQRIKSPIYSSGTNPGGTYRYTNTFYMLKDDAPPGQLGWTTFEKYGYDDTYIYIMRDADWGGPGASYGMFLYLTQAGRLRSQDAANGNDYVGTFAQTTSVADVSGLCRGCFFTVPAGTVSTGYWAKRYMNLYDYVDAGFQNHNIPNWITAFNRNRDDGTWRRVQSLDFPWPEIVQLYDHGYANFGGAVGYREYIVMRRFVDATHDNPPCYPPDCPYLDERYWYAKDIGLVRFELFDYGDPVNPNPQVTWANVADDFGPVWDVSTYYTSPPTPPIDPAYDHVYVNFASQMSSKHAQIFFMTDQEPWFSEDKSASLDINNDGSWQTYDFNFSGNKKWRGTIIGIRFDPTDGPGRAGWYNSCGCLGWQRIRIGTETKSSYSAVWDISGNGDTEGFSLYNMGSWGWIFDNRWKWIMQPSTSDPQIYRTNINIGSGR